MSHLGPGLGLDTVNARRRAPFFHGHAYRLDGAAPTLVADFARGRYARAGATAPVSDILAVSGAAKRIVAADGTIAISPADAPAFTWRSGRPRLLIEGPATNLLKQSTSFAATLAASTYVFFQVSGQLATNLTNDAPYSMSVWARRVSPAPFDFTFYTWNPSLAVFKSSHVVQVGTTWERIEAVGMLGGGSNCGFRLPDVGVSTGSVADPTCPVPGATVRRILDGAGNEIHLAAPQVEAGAIVTSYIPTAGAAVTRIADVVQLTPAAAAPLQGAAASLAWRGRVCAAEASQPLVGLPSGYALLRGGTTPAELRLDGSSAAALSLGAVLPGEIGAAIAWDGAGRAGSVNGAAAVSDAAGLDRSRAAVLLGGSAGLPAGCALEVDELVAWAVRGSGAGLTAQARGWL